MPSDTGADAPRPRLCHLVKWPDFDGYGFNLHAEKAKFGQFIGKVDEGSPAESAGMKEGDRIIEVNGVNVSNENHKQVVERIKAISNETKLLVVDLETDKYYKNKKIVVKSSMSNVMLLKTAPSRANAAAEKHSLSNGGANNGNGSTHDSEADDRRSQASSIASDGESLNQEGDKVSRNGSNLSTPPIARSDDGHRSTSSASPEVGMTPPLTPTGGGPALQRSVSAESGGSTGKGLNLNMTASEMRALLASRKKYDPKKENLDLRKKHAIIQDM